MQRQLTLPLGDGTQAKIPEHWRIATVADVGVVQLGQSLSPSRRTGANPIPYLRAANITHNAFDLTDILKMDFSASEFEKYRLLPGDVLLAEASGSPDQVGRSAIWSGQIEDCCFQNTVIRFRSEEVFPEFSHIVFQAHHAKGGFARIAKGVGIQHLSASRFKRLLFPVPPRDEQLRIAKTVNQISIRLDAVSKQLTAASSLLRKQMQTAFARILASGPRVPLRQICRATNGYAFKSSEWSTKGLPIIRIQNLKNASARFNHFTGSADPRHIVVDGDLLFAWSGTPETSFGPFIWSGPKAVLNQHIFKIEINDDIVDKRYLFHTLNGLREWFIARAIGGGGLAHIRKSDFMEAQISLPSIEEQRKKAATLDELLTKQETQQTTIKKTTESVEELRAKLMQQAISGSLNEAEFGMVEDIQIEEVSDPSDARPSDPREVQFSRTGRRNLIEVLTELGPLSAQSLLELSGYRTDEPAQVEEFYSELEKALRFERIVAFQDPELGQRLLKANTL